MTSSFYSDKKTFQIYFSLSNDLFKLNYDSWSKIIIIYFFYFFSLFYVPHVIHNNWPGKHFLIQKNMQLYIDRSFKFHKFNILLFASMRYNLWFNLINIRPVKPLLHGKLRLNSLSYSRHVHKAILELWCVLNTFLSTFYLFTCFLS